MGTLSHSLVHIHTERSVALSVMYVITAVQNCVKGPLENVHTVDPFTQTDSISAVENILVQMATQ